MIGMVCTYSKRRRIPKMLEDDSLMFMFMLDLFSNK